jgi:ABC-type multidrug transport system fused ATPase/permease subunit
LVLVRGKAAFTGTWHDLLKAEPDDAEAREAVRSICSSVQERDDDHDEVSTSEASMKATDREDRKEYEEGVIMTEEERDFGLSNLQTWMSWFKGAGGIVFFFVTLSALTVDRGFYVANEWWLATWTSAEFESIRRFGIRFSAQSDGLDAQIEFIKVYVVILIISFAATFARSLYIVQGGARCSEKLFLDMTTRVIHAPMSYFETTPIGRILNRLTYDVEVLDITLSQSMTVLMISIGWFVTGVVLQITILPWNACIIAPIIAIYWLLLLYYRKSAVDLQRLDALSRSPVQADLAEGKLCVKDRDFFCTQFYI